MRKEKQLRTFLTHNFDFLIAWISLALGIISSVAIITLKIYQAIGLSLLLLVAALTYILFRKKITDEDLKYSQPEIGINNDIIKRLLLIGSEILVFILSITSIFTSINSTYRPLWVFFVLAIIPTIIFFTTSSYSNYKESKPILRAETIIFTITFITIGTSIFPYNGSDTLRLTDFANSISSTGNFENIIGAYINFPLYPFFIHLLSDLFSTSTADSARILSVLTGLLFVLLYYSIADRLKFSNFHSQILILILIGSKWFIYWTTFVVTMTFSALFFSLVVIIFTISYTNKHFSRNQLIFLNLILFFTPFLHPMIAAGVVLFSGCFGIILIINKNDQGLRPKNIFPIALVSIVILISQWMFYGNQLFDRIIPSILAPIFVDEASFSIAQTSRDPLGYLIDQISFFPLLLFGYIEILRQIKIQKSKLNIYYGLLGVFFVVFGYSTQIVNFSNVLPHRWLFLGTLCLVFPAASNISVIFQSQRKFGQIASTLLVFLIFLFAFIDTESNADHPLYNIESTNRLDITASEYGGFNALKRLIEIRKSEIRFDYQVWDFLYFQYEPQNFPNIGYWRTMTLDDYSGIFTVRTLHFDRSNIFEMPFDQVPLHYQNLSLFYDSGDFWMIEKSIPHNYSDTEPFSQ